MQVQIPRLSAPLTKAIRTSEGILTWLSSVVIAIGAAIDPSKLPPKVAAIVVGALTVAHSVSRTILKATAIQKDLGVDAPIPFDPVALDEAASFASSVEAAFAGGAPALLDEPAAGPVPGEADPTLSQDVLPPADGANQRATSTDPLDQIPGASDLVSEPTPAWGSPMPDAPLPSDPGPPAPLPDAENGAAV
jgi:hypothetical protein